MIYTNFIYCCCSILETYEITLLIFFLKKEAVMLMPPKNIFTFCRSTVHPVNIHIIRPNDRKTHAKCKRGTSGQRGSGYKA